MVQQDLWSGPSFVLQSSEGPGWSHLVSDGGPDGFVEELDADDGQQTDGHRQDDGQPQVRLTESVGRHAYKQKDHFTFTVKLQLRKPPSYNRVLVPHNTFVLITRIKS